MKLLFRLLDDDDKLVTDGCVPIGFDAADFAKAEAEDADAMRAFDNPQPHVVTMIARNYGKGRVIRDMTQAAGVLIYKNCQHALLMHFGVEVPGDKA